MAGCFGQHAVCEAINLSSLGRGPLTRRAQRDKSELRQKNRARPKRAHSPEGYVCREAFNVPGLPCTLSMWAPSATCLSRSQIIAHCQDIAVCMCVHVCVRVCVSTVLHLFVFLYTCMPVKAFHPEDRSLPKIFTVNW